MAELSKDGSGVPAVMSSASTPPSVSARLSRTGGSCRTVARISARWPSTDSMPLPAGWWLASWWLAGWWLAGWWLTGWWLAGVWLHGGGSLEVVEVLAEPGHELAGHVGPLAGELDERPQIVDLVAGVVAAAAEQHAVYAAAAAVGRIALRQNLERVGELDLPAAAWLGLAEHVEHGRVADVAPDHDPVARRVGRFGLLDQVGDGDDVVVVLGRLEGGAAVVRDLVDVDFHQREDGSAVLDPDLQHPLEQAVFRVDEVVAEQHGEGLMADVLSRAQHGVTEARRRALPHVVHVGEVAGLADQGQPGGVTLRGERFLEFVGAVEVIFDGALAPAGDEQEVVEAGRDSFLDHVLDRWLVDDRQHLLGRRLRRGQEPGSQARRRDDRLGHWASVRHVRYPSRSGRPGGPRPGEPGRTCDGPGGRGRVMAPEELDATDGPGAPGGPGGLSGPGVPGGLSGPGG